MSIAAVPLDSAAPLAARSPTSTIVRSSVDDPYNATADLSFGDFLDMINPLQHIPVIGTLYRAITGDSIKPASQVIGGIAFGGPIGGAAAIISAVIGQANGRSVEDTMLASLGMSGDHPNVEIAAAAPAAQPPSKGEATGAATAGAAAAAASSAATATVVAQAGAAPAAGAAAPAAAAPATTQATPAAAQASAGPTALTAAAQPADKAASPIGDHKPSKMPVRDTMLASTLQSKNAAAIALRSRPQAASAPVLGPTTVAPMASAAGAQSADPSAAAPQEPISDVMMRNLAKYEAAKKALNPTTPTIRTAS